MADIPNFKAGVEVDNPARPSFSISRFKEAVAYGGGLARPFYFTVQIIGGPFGGATTAFNFDESLLRRLIPFPLPRPEPSPIEHQILMCRSAEVPEQTIQTTDIHYHSRTLKLPSNRAFQPTTLTFLHVNNTSLRGQFEHWLRIFNDPENNQQIPAPIQDHMGTVVLTQYDMNGRSWIDFMVNLLSGGDLARVVPPQTRYVLHQAFPITVSPLRFDHEADTEVQTYDVQFQYQWFDRVQLTAVPPQKR